MIWPLFLFKRVVSHVLIKCLFLQEFSNHSVYKVVNLFDLLSMKYINQSVLFLYLVVLFSFHLHAQKNIFIGDYEGLNNELKIVQAEKEAKVEKYLKDSGLERWQLKSDGTVTYLAEIDDFGLPIYVITHNQGAAFTTGASHFRSSNSGLNLDGSNVRIAIWDGGAVRNSHVEFQDRVLAVNGQSVDNHATHVMGTILAKGVLATSVGMAPNARALSYDFADDTQEMLVELSPDRELLLLSNHSYGRPAGWYDGRWLGPEGESQDPRFGHYSGTSRTIDQFAYNAPYYLIVKSAGNQRNENPHYDIITDFGLSKNNLTVGAVQKISSEYEKPSDIRMSSFSSWGPTDDGRIKPDIVAPGVGLLSATSSSDESYGSLSGTSMAAPSATGSLALIQQLYSQLSGGEYMKSSMLKALVLHTAFESGIHPGPDYQFGWGLINTRGAVNTLLKENGSSTTIKDFNLSTGEQVSIDLAVKSGFEVKATIVWTDVPGTPVPLALDNRTPMLVNDLDLRILNNNEVHFPWILDPERPTEPAKRADNFRDNVEQVVFVPEGDNHYRLVISHKGILQNGNQTVSLILTYQSQADDQSYYWLGKDSDWSNPLNWSRTTNGVSDGSIPSKGNLILFDENSTVNEIVLSEDSEIRGLKRLSKKPLTIDLNGQNLTFYAGINNAFPNFNFTGEGSVIFKGEPGFEYAFIPKDAFKNVAIVFDSPDVSWVFGSDASFGKTTLLNGSFSIIGKNIDFEELTVAESINHLTIEHSNIDIKKLLSIVGNAPQFNFDDVEFALTGESTQLISTIKLDNIVVQDSAILENEIAANQVHNFGSLWIKQHLITDIFITEKGTSIDFSPDAILEITNDFISTGDEENLIHYSSLEGNGTVVMDGHYLICLDYLNLENVDFVGNASVSAGLHSSIRGSVGWFDVACENVLYADFTADYLCTGSVPYFTNSSNGEIDHYEWSLSTGQIFENELPYFSDTVNSSIEITLTVSSGEIQKSLTRSYDLLPNSLVKNKIVQSGDLLASLRSSDTFQWFKDFKLIENANQRTFNPEKQSGNYFVLTFNETCNRKSDDFEFFVLGLNNMNDHVSVYPNPSTDELNIKFENDYYGEVKVLFFDLSGKILKEYTFNKTYQTFHKIISVSELDGNVILNFSIQDKVYSQQLFIKN